MRGLLFSGVNWVRTNEVDGSTNGPCLRYSGALTNEWRALGFNCNNNGWFICEHGQQTTTPDPTNPTVSTSFPLITTTTAPGPGGPNINACSLRDNLFDSNGAYLKSVCVMASGQNYNNAQQICRSNGMELFVINSSQTQRAFRNSITELLAAHPRGFAWINGRVDDDCGNWYNFSPNRELMFRGVHWVQTDDVIGRESGECLRFTAQHSVSDPNWQGQGTSCSASSWFICEFMT